MQFREQGRKVQCIRVHYDPELGRSRQTVVASFDRSVVRDLPSEVVALLTADEREAAEKWMLRRRRRTEAKEAAEIMTDPAGYLVAFRQAVWMTEPERIEFDSIRNNLALVEVALKHKERYARESRANRRRASKEA